MELNQLTIHELQEKIKAGETTSTEIVQAVFRRIDAVEKDVHAYILLTREKALEGAVRADEEIKAGQHQDPHRYSDCPERSSLHKRGHDDLRVPYPP